MCERFLQMLSEGEHPVEVWHVQYAQGAITATCRIGDYKRVRPAARRTGTRVHHVRQSGLYRWWRPLAARGGLLVGAAMAMVLYMVLASSIWVIDVQVEDAALRHRIEAQLAASGVTRGTAIRDVDVATVRMEAIAAMEELHQLSLYFEGCVARVEVRLQGETLSPPDPRPANIVAATDGLILSTQVTAGQSMVKVGEAVVEGDLLVCGAIETEKGMLFRHATAIIRAQTTHEITVIASKEEWRSVTTQTRIQPTLWLFDCALPLYSEMAVTEETIETNGEKFLTLFDTPLPLGVTWIRREERAEEPVSYTTAQAETLARWRLTQLARQTLAGVEIADVTYDGVWDGAVYRLTATFTCIEDIAKTVPLLTDMA